MAKRYYWLKLPEDFFRQKSIKKLRKIAGGDTYTVIYLKMLLIAIKQDCRLYFDGVEADFCTELALDLDEDLENVKVTVSFLLAQGLMVIDQESEYHLTDCDRMVGSETASAQRMRDLRKRKTSHCDTDVTPALHDRYVEKEIDTREREDTRERGREEKESDTREELERETEEEKNISSASKKALETRKARELFEHLWSLYPKKRGKSNVSDTKKKQLLAVGRENMEAAIANYIDEIERNHTDMQYVKHGSSFFNGAYVDYLPENFSPLPVSRPARGSRGESVEDYMRRTEGWERYADDYAGIQPDQGDHQE